MAIKAHFLKGVLLEFFNDGSAFSGERKKERKNEAEQEKRPVKRKELLTQVSYLLLKRRCRFKNREAKRRLWRCQKLDL